MARVAVKAQLTGDKQMLGLLETLAGDQGMRKELRRAAKEVWGKRVPIMQARTPEKTGRLKRSEKMRVMVSSKKEDIRFSLIAGGPLAPYAAIVHEGHATQAKFMESVIREAVPTVGRELAAEINIIGIARRTVGR